MGTKIENIIIQNDLKGLISITAGECKRCLREKKINI
jgi:hypothetical protein